MPHSNRSPSSPSLRDPSKPALDELLPRSHSMSSSRLPLSRSYSIRSFSTRRSRPSVASIADVFVGSLVLAGFCHEHSPRGHTFSTLSMRASEPNLRELRRRSRQYNGAPPAQRHLGISGYPVRQSRRGSWFSHALEPSESRHSEKSKPSSPTNEYKAGDNYYSLPRLPEIPDSSSHPAFEDRFFDSISDESLASANKESSDKGIEQTTETTEIPPAPPVSLTRDEKVRIAISSTFDRLFGKKFDWTEALDALAPMKTIYRDADESRDVMESMSVAKLVHALPSSARSSEQHLFGLYRRIPSPGVSYLSRTSRGRLLRRLATSPNKRQVDARRFLAVVNDMIAAGLPMARSLWSSAIHMAGRSKDGQLPKRRLMKAVGLWQHMEHVAGVKADAVTFNILFEIATKANQFVVADRLEQEMRSRGMSFTRMGHVSKIYACGMRKDVPGIRENFNAFVAAGEIVDTVVLNCLMAAFLRSGDIKTAEQLYGQMLQTQLKENKRNSGSRFNSKDQPSLSPELTFYRAKARGLARILEKSKQLQARLPAFHRELQDSQSLVPDTRTFYIWLQHCVRVSGNLDMFMNVLHDMERTYDVPPRYLIYLLLFEGFATHGRRKKNVWTAEKLRLTWVSFLQAVRASHTGHKSGAHERPSMTWDNPLRFEDNEIETPGPVTPNDADDLYINLPSADGPAPYPAPKRSSIDLIDPIDPDNPQGHRQGLPLENEEPVEVDPQDLLDDLELENEEPVDIDAIDIEASESEDDSISAGYQDEESLENLDLGEGEAYSPYELTPEEENDVDRQHYEYLSHRLENGVFVGSRMIKAIVRAFGTCFGPNEVLEVWLTLEPLWVSSKKRASEVLSVKEVVDEEMARNPRKM